LIEKEEEETRKEEESLRILTESIDKNESLKGDCNALNSYFQ